MLEETSDSVSQENTEQEVQPETSEDARDYKEAFNQEKSYSQKTRLRAQAAESELAKYQARNKKMEEEALAEKGKYKELWDKDKEDAEWAREYKKTQRASLLESLPEDKREKFNNMNLSFTALQAIAEEFANKPSETMKAVPGQVSTPVSDKPYAEMTESEKRQYFEQATKQI